MEIHIWIIFVLGVPLILGHSNEMLLENIEAIFRKGTSYGVPCQLEVEMATEIVKAYKSVDSVRMVNSGTEATMSALRVARAFTNRNKILKFEGCLSWTFRCLIS